MQPNPSLRRERRALRRVSSVEVEYQGRVGVQFASNDYLALAQHPAIIAAWQQAATRYGVGSGASAYVSGYSPAQQALEEELAAYVQRPRALVFGSGYLANLGTLSALLTRQDVVLADRLCHASLLDGVRLAGAQLRRYPHRDLAALAQQLATSSPRCWVITDSIFSMDGDWAPLPELVQLCQQAGARLYVDDAHGLGVVGPQGRGALAALQLDTEAVPLALGALGKALGVMGAFVSGSEAWLDVLVQQARTAIYSTALPPALAEAARVALRLAQAETWRREHLHALITHFQTGAAALALPILPSDTPIQPVWVGDNARALRLSQCLWEQGFWVPAIRPPTVPPGSARLRVSLSAGHTIAQVDALLAALKTHWNAVEA